MEVVALNNNSVRIKAKNISFVINPQGKIESDVVILTKKASDYAHYQDKIVFDGPGEYEVSGVSVKAGGNAGKLFFDFLEDTQKVLVLSSVESAKDKETGDYNATIIIPDEKVDGDLSSVVSDVVAVAGSEEFLPADKANVKKADKINLKKTEEYKGFIVHLSK